MGTSNRERATSTERTLSFLIETVNTSNDHLDVQSSQAGIDLIGDAVGAMRTGRPQVARALLHPPWGLRFPPAGAIGVQVVLKGHAWLTGPGDAEPIRLEAGDIALVRRHAPYSMADHPASSLWDADFALHVPAEHWPDDGSALHAKTGGTALLGGTYDLAAGAPTRSSPTCPTS
jgi:hypothetical protein